MSEGSSGGGEKTEQPTEKKLNDARKRGEVAKSSDVSSAAGYLGLVVAFVSVGVGTIDRVGGDLSLFLSRADSLPSRVLTFGGAYNLEPFLIDVVVGIVPIFAIPMVMVVFSLIAQRAVVFTPEKLMPKRSRISPVSIAGNKFGPSGLFEFSKSFVKLFIFASVLAVYISVNDKELLGSVYAPAAQVGVLLVRNLIQFLWLVFAIAAVISIVDYFWQSFEHRRKNMMSKQEIQDESKESEGDPYTKQKRRQRGYDIATQRMIADVPSADVVIVNPQHYAVALKWDRSTDAAPVCVAKGVDEIAARIREAAAGAGVPVRRDPPTARAIYAVVKIGAEIEPVHYKSVAAAIRFAENVRKMAGRRR